MDKKTESIYNKQREILKCLIDNPNIPVSSLSKLLNINRLTLNYYLKKLEKSNFIKRDRKINIKGRPTYFIVDEKKSYQWINFEKLQDDFMNKIRLEILKIFNANPNIEFEQVNNNLIKIFPEKDKEILLDYILEVMGEGYIIQTGHLSSEGKKFLEANINGKPEDKSK